MEEELEFYDVKGKKKFKTSNYTTEIKNGRKFAIAIAPSGVRAYRIMKNE